MDLACISRIGCPHLQVYGMALMQMQLKVDVDLYGINRFMENI